MATTTRVLTANVNGTVYTTNANGALEAIDTCHSGSTAPTNEVANGKFWLDTTTTPGILKMYNNAAWEVIGGSTSNPTFGDVTLSKTTPAINISGTTGYLGISGDASVAAGSNIRLYGSTATSANDMLFRANTSVELRYNDSSSLWDFQANDITTTGTATAGALDVVGDAEVSGNFTVDVSTLYVSSTNNRVGVGTVNPTVPLDVVGDAEVSGSITLGDELLGKVVTYANSQNAPYLIAGTTGYTGATTNWGTYGFQHRLKSDAGGAARITVDTRVGEVYSLTEAGALTVSDGIYLGGTVAANKLDDYEEGTFTPRITFGGATAGITYTSRNGYYTKVGRLVTAQVWIDLLNNGTATGNALIEQLPFTSSSSTNAYSAGAHRTRNILIDNPGGLMYRLSPSSTIINIERYTDTGGFAFIDETDIEDDYSIMLTISYIVD